MKKCKISDIFDFEKGSLQSSKNIPGEYDFITASIDWKTHNAYTHDCEALIIAVAASGSLGRAHYVNGKFISSDLCFILQPKSGLKNEINLQFYHIYFNFIREDLVYKTATGSAKKAINQQNFANYEIVLPEIKEQNSFITKVNKANDDFTNLTISIDDNLDLIKKLRRLILQEAVQGKLVPQDPNDEPASELLKKIKLEKEKLIKEGQIKKEKNLPPISEDEKPYPLPQGWEWARFIDVANIASNLINPLDYPNSPHIAPNNIEKETGKLLNYTTILEDKVFSIKHYFYANQILYSKIRPNLSKVITVDFEGLCSADMYPIKAFIDRFYLHKYMLSTTFLSFSVKNDTRVAMPKINQEELNKVPVPVPPLEEQKKIVEKVDGLMKHCNELEEQITQSKKHSEHLMQSILQEAFNSKEQSTYKSNVIDITETINKRAVYNAYMISKLGNDIGAIKNEKLNYLGEMVLGLSLGGNYRKEAAGPLDIESRSKVKEIFKQLKWFNVIEGNENQKEQYIPDANLKEHKELFDLCFGNKKSEIDKLLNLFKNKNSEECEAVATLYAVWNDLLIDKKSTSQEDIIEGFFKWSAKKKNFNRQDLYDNLTWMKYHKLIPSGKGKKTIPKSKQLHLLSH